MSEQMNDEQQMTPDQAGNRIAWFMVGVVIGGAAAILYAPRSGRDTREFLAKKTQESRDAVESTSRDIVERSRDIYEKGRQLVDDAAELFERGRKLVRG